MATIKMSVWVGEDKTLVVELPADTPTGLMEIVIIPQEVKGDTYSPQYPEAWVQKRKQLRQKLLEANLLSTAYHAPAGTVPLSPEALLRLGSLPPGIRSTDELIDEDRGLRYYQTGTGIRSE
jgi:hypothetical protein